MNKLQEFDKVAKQTKKNENENENKRKINFKEGFS